ncbi:L-histidine N(alpha)-methyltransferase [Salinisphaera aquimarina]|uniref:L-histidine N(Alpha)-methyltransferase n=1 Tax=Salinisphaera aquimarina TaxID=2094031 RepID=A0ABV7EW45_9GAMM
MRLSLGTRRLSSSEITPARALPTLVDDARAGLLAPPRQLPPKYFYDDYGSQLFEAICATPEYYPSRAEASLLSRHATQIIERAAPDHMLELGSGSSRKTRLLFDACDALAMPCIYWPFDVSAQMMLDAGAALVTDYSWLSVHALIGDYTGGIGNLPLPAQGRRLIVFLGGTLGNFEPDQARAMLGEIVGLLRGDDLLLLGVDRVKDTARLEAAYDDAQGITAEFNRNVLTVLNRELDADFDLAAYRHRAVFDEQRARIEMRLVSERDHSVRLGALDTTIEITAGEEIVTEFSHKFTPASIEALLADAGLIVDTHFEADQGDYSLLLVRRDS